MVDSAALEQWIQTLSATEAAKIKKMSRAEQEKMYVSLFQAKGSGNEQRVGDNFNKTPSSAVTSKHLSNYSGVVLSDLMIEYVDDNWGAISDSQFQGYLDELSKFSASELISFIRHFEKDGESVMEMIMDESNNAEDEKAACRKVFNALVKKAEELGIDTKNYKAEFNYNLSFQYTANAFIMDSSKLDEIVNALVSEIELKQNFTFDEVNRVNDTPTSQSSKEATEILENRLSSANRDFNAQLKADGWAGDFADLMGNLWNSKNTADSVRGDLSKAQKQLNALKMAASRGESAFKSEFKKIFGVEYNYGAIVAYQKAEQNYVAAKAEQMFKRGFKNLLSDEPLKEEKRRMLPKGHGEMVEYYDPSLSKEQVYDREYEALAEYLGEHGAEIINAKFKQLGLENAPIEKKYEGLKELAKEVYAQLNAQKVKVCGGNKSFEDVESAYQSAYKSAYGYSNNIMKRVSDYNASQQAGAAAVKAGVVVAATLGAAFTGGGTLAVAGVAAGATVAAEVTDKATTGNALDVLREKGLAEYLKTVGDDVDWNTLMKEAVISGGAVIIGGVVAKGVSFVSKGMHPAKQAISMFGADVAVDATLTKLTTGEIRVGDLVFSVLLSGAGNIVAMRKGGLGNGAANKPEPTKPQEPKTQESKQQEPFVSRTPTQPIKVGPKPKKGSFKFEEDDVTRPFWNLNRGKVDTPVEPVNNRKLGQNEFVLVTDNATITLGGNSVVNFAEPNLRSLLLKMRDGDSITVGRYSSTDCPDYVIPGADRQVSRRHLIIQKRGNAFTVINVSQNGCVVNSAGSHAVAQPSPRAVASSQSYNLRNGMEVSVSMNAKIRVGKNNCIVDFNEPALKRMLQNLREGQTIVIGRGSSCHYIIPNADTSISKQHLIIGKIGGKLVVKDVSTNGSTVYDSPSNNPRAAANQSYSAHGQYTSNRAGIQQAQKFNRENKIGCGEKITDGYIDAGKMATLTPDGRVTNSKREILVVDRRRDRFLNEMINDVKAQTAGMNEAEKAIFIYDYICNLESNGLRVKDTSVEASELWSDANIGQKVLLGDEVFKTNPNVVVCRHRSLLFKVLADEVGLNVELNRGYLNCRDGGRHAWNTVRFRNGDVYVFDLAQGYYQPARETGDLYLTLNRARLYYN